MLRDDLYLYPLKRKLGGAQSWSGHFGEEKTLLLLFESKSQLLGRPAFPVPLTQADKGQCQTKYGS
jgi:hypothetical protein